MRHLRFTGGFGKSSQKKKGNRLPVGTLPTASGEEKFTEQRTFERSWPHIDKGEFGERLTACGTTNNHALKREKA